MKFLKTNEKSKTLKLADYLLTVIDDEELLAETKKNSEYIKDVEFRVKVIDIIKFTELEENYLKKKTTTVEEIQAQRDYLHAGLADFIGQGLNFEKDSAEAIDAVIRSSYAWLVILAIRRFNSITTEESAAFFF